MSIAEEFRHSGEMFSQVRKADRLAGWNIQRRLVAEASKRGEPGLYVSRAREYL